ncbi:hypothetical protein [Microbacterium indicum]|uniref:hypothetical protein n=1 Tax=Microbacterium indicum TaxID=358100 RepID=UPI00048AF3CB|nr:hypothetical protein [Microbacterium indicum]
MALLAVPLVAVGVASVCRRLVLQSLRRPEQPRRRVLVRGSEDAVGRIVVSLLGFVGRGREVARVGGVDR